TRPQFSAVAAGVCCVIILFDQVPTPPSLEEKSAITRHITSDQKFVAEIESTFPEGAMVFQIPVMDFPESPLRTESSYDHLRPYLYTRHLRSSFGSMKGRPREQWQHDVEKLSLLDAVAEDQRRSFYIRDGAILHLAAATATKDGPWPRLWARTLKKELSRARA